MEWQMIWTTIGVIGGLVTASFLILRNDISHLRSTVDKMDTRIGSVEHYITRQEGMRDAFAMMGQKNNTKTHKGDI